MRLKGATKQFVVIDGHKEKQYDGVGMISFSLDSKHLAYAAKKDAVWFVVIDGNEGKQYDTVFRGGGIMFGSLDSLHYLVQKGNSIYLVKKLIE